MRRLVILSLTLVALCTAPLGASGGAPISFTSGIPEVAIPGPLVGRVFYQATFFITYTGGPVMMGSRSNGKGNIFVDDVLFVQVTHPDGKVASYAHDYSSSCRGAITPTGPVNLKNLFQKGLNKVQITMQDLCGAGMGASPFWIAP